MQYYHWIYFNDPESFDKPAPFHFLPNYLRVYGLASSSKTRVQRTIVIDPGETRSVFLAKVSSNFNLERISPVRSDSLKIHEKSSNDKASWVLSRLTKQIARLFASNSIGRVFRTYRNIQFQICNWCPENNIELQWKEKEKVGGLMEERCSSGMIMECLIVL